MAIVATPYLAIQLTEILGRINGKKIFRNLSGDFHIVAYSCLAIFIAFNAFFGFHKYQSNNFRILVEPHRYPWHATQFLQQNRIYGNMLVPFDWGEYMIWKLPQSKVSIDGRFRTVYPEKVIVENENFANHREGWSDIISKYPTDIIVARKSDGTHKLVKKHQLIWAKIYEDPISVIFVHKGAPREATLKYVRKSRIISTDPPSYEFP